MEEVMTGQAPLKEHSAAIVAETAAEKVICRPSERADRQLIEARDNLGIIAADSCRHRGIEISGWQVEGLELEYFPPLTQQA